MSTVINARDVLLQAAASRYSNSPNAALILSPSTPAFHINTAGANDPATIIFTATLIDIAGTVVFTASGGTVTTAGNVATLTYGNMSSATATVTASLTVNGITYSDTCFVSKVYDGTTGVNNTRVYAYQRTASAPTGTPGDVTVTFASNSITAPAALANGWVRDIPTANGNPLYVTAISGAGAGSTVNLLSAGWSAAAVMATDGPGGTGTDGINGLNSATIMIYQRSASATAPALPSAATTYTFATGVVAGLNNGWTQGVPAADVTKPFLQTSLATAVSASATDTMAASEWSAAQVLAQDGTSGGSIYPSVEDAGWLYAGGAASVLATVTDGKTGPGVRRSATNSQSYITHAKFFQIDRTRTYRTRFWARASSTANGTLYHTLQQFLSNGSAGPTNGGRSPYKPPGAGPASSYLDWTEFSQTWSAADWQTGVTQIKPDFLLNYAGSVGYWEIQGFEMTDVTEVVAAQTAASNAAAQALAANNKYDAIASDGVLDRSEKVVTVLDWATVNGEYGGIVAKASDLSVSSTTYASAYSSLSTYLSSLSPAFNDVSQDTTLPGVSAAVARAAFNSAWTGYYNAKAALETAIYAKTATLSTWPGTTGFGKPSDNATADISLVVSGTGLTLVGNSVTRTGGAGWDASVRSINGHTGGAFCSFSFDASSETMAGLNSDPTTSDHYNTIDYAWYGTSGNLYIYLNGTPYSGGAIITTFVPTDILSVVMDGSNVFFIKSGVVQVALSVPSSPTLYFDTSLVVGTIRSIRFGPMTSNLWGAIGGPNRPADNATVGAPSGTLVAGVSADTVATGAASGATALATVNNPPVISGLYDVTFNGATNNVYVNYVTFTASKTGGSGTPTYAWVLSTYFGIMELSSATGATVTVRGKANNLYCIGQVTCTVTTNGATSTMSCEVSVGHGSGTAP